VYLLLGRGAVERDSREGRRWRGRGGGDGDLVDRYGGGGL